MTTQSKTNYEKTFLCVKFVEKANTVLGSLIKTVPFHLILRLLSTMKLTFIGHASVLIETNGISILSDPWWKGPCFGAQWWNRPNPDTTNIPELLDYIYISHGHQDHLHFGTLKTLSRKAKILVSSTLSLKQSLSDLGFTVIEINPDEPLRLDENINVWIWPTYGGDTLFVLKDESEVLINLNDALHAAPSTIQDSNITKLNSMFPHADYVFCGYGTASHFPNCYFIPGKNDKLTAAKRQKYFNGEWSKIMHSLQPKYGFPFAANVFFFEDDLIGLNETSHNTERPTEHYLSHYGKTNSQLLDIAPGFQIEQGKITVDSKFSPVHTELYVKNDPEAYHRANNYSEPNIDEIDNIIDLLRKNITICSSYLNEHKSNYRFGILFRGSQKGILVEKISNNITVKLSERAQLEDRSCDLTYETRAVYLKYSLLEPYADETLFVGSGGIFRYSNKKSADSNLHRELMTILRKNDAAPLSRYGNNSQLLFHIKQFIKKMLGRDTEDLYDLKKWIVYD